jgi:hypothetical protein
MPDGGREAFWNGPRGYAPGFAQPTEAQRWPYLPIFPWAHATAARVRIRTKLSTAAAQVNLHPPRASPRWQVLRRSPTVVIPPPIASTPFRFRGLTTSPGWRIVRPAIALDRPAVCCATCGVTCRSRHSRTKSRVASCLSAPGEPAVAPAWPPPSPGPPPAPPSPSPAALGYRRPSRAASP